jgi:hypothetical protein
MRNCTCFSREGHDFSCPMAGNNQPFARVKATIFRNAFIAPADYGSIETEAWVTLDERGTHATWAHDGCTEQLQRLNSTLDYSFDAPDTLCPIGAKQHHIDANRIRICDATCQWHATLHVVSSACYWDVMVCPTHAKDLIAKHRNERLSIYLIESGQVVTL